MRKPPRRLQNSPPPMASSGRCMTPSTKIRINWGLPLLFALAAALGLPEADLRNALAAGKYAPKVRADFLGGARSGVNGTPTFFINGERHNGTFEFDDLVAAIELHPPRQGGAVTS